MRQQKLIQVYSKKNWIVYSLFLIGNFIFGTFWATAQEIETHLLKTLAGRGAKIEAVAYNEQGTLIAFADHAGSIFVYDTYNYKSVYNFEGHTATVNELTFKNNYLASASDDGTVAIWDMNTGRRLRTIQNPLERTIYKAAYFVVFSDSGNELFMGGNNGQIFKINLLLADSKPEKLYACESYITSCVAVPNNTQMLAFGTSRYVNFFDLKTQKIAHGIRNQAIVNDLKFDKTGSMLAVWTEDGSLNVYGMPQKTVLLSLKAGTADYNHVAFSNSGKMVACGGFGAEFKIWDIDAKKFVVTNKEHGEMVKMTAFNPNNAQIASASYDGTVKVWELHGVTPTPILQPQPSVSFAPQESVVVTTPPPAHKSTPIPVALTNRTVTEKATIKVNNLELTLEIWDDKQPDGDVITLYFNNKCILDKYETVRKKRIITLTLDPKNNNTLVLYAHNLGTKPPNTAVVNLLDGKNARRFNLSSDLKKSEAINIVYSGAAE